MSSNAAGCDARLPFESSSDTPPLARTAPAKSRNSSNVSMKLDFPDALGPTRTFSDRRSKKSMSGGNESSPGMRSRWMNRM